MASTSLSEYAVRLRVDDLADQLRREGFQVADDVDGDFDLVAERAGRRYAYHVIARGDKYRAASRAFDLHKKARARQFDEFRLVVASPPARKSIGIPNLEPNLTAALQSGNWDDLLQLGAKPTIVEVSDVEVRELDLSQEPWSFEARGTVLVEFTARGEEDGDREAWYFPFTVTGTLGRSDLAVRVSSFSPRLGEYFSEEDEPDGAQT